MLENWDKQEKWRDSTRLPCPELENGKNHDFYLKSIEIAYLFNLHFKI